MACSQEKFSKTTSISTHHIIHCLGWREKLHVAYYSMGRKLQRYSRLRHAKRPEW